MCEVLDRIEKRGIERGIKQGIKQVLLCQDLAQIKMGHFSQ